MEVNKELKDEIWDYCRANNITNIDEFMTKCLKQGFTATKFGSSPFEQKEKIVEKIVEVMVEKEVFISDNKEMQKLTKEIDKLNKIIKTTAENKDKAIKELSALEIEHKKLKLELEQEKNKKKKDLYGE